MELAFTKLSQVLTSYQSVRNSVGVCIILGIIFVVAKSGRREKNLPPGPPTIPLLGNLHQIPLKQAFIKLTEWSKVYGPIFSLKLGDKTMIVVNDSTTVRELLDKRSSISSDRPDNHVGDGIITNGHHILLMHYNGRYRDVRKVVHQYLMAKNTEKYKPIQEAESTQMVRDILQRPDKFYDHVRRYSSAVILAMVYGMRGKVFSDPRIQAIYHVMERFTEILETGATPPIDIFPFLRWFPRSLASWKTKAQSIRQDELDLYMGLLEGVRTRKKVESRDTFADALLDLPNDGRFSDEQLGYMAGIMFEAGSDTTASTILSFMLAMCKFPEVQRRAQEEIDSVVGRDRVPTFEDSLPYITCIVKETLRWRPVAAGGIPHATTADDEYMGYSIPKGSILLPNTWAVHHDPKHYPNPEVFDPSRFESVEITDAKPDEVRRGHYAYGYGRRICSGMHVADRSLFITMSKLLWAFEISASYDVNVGFDAYSPGFVTIPLPYKCSFRPRHPKVPEVLNKAMDDANSFLSQFE